MIPSTVQGTTTPSSRCSSILACCVMRHRAATAQTWLRAPTRAMPRTRAHTRTTPAASARAWATCAWTMYCRRRASGSRARACSGRHRAIRTKRSPRPATITWCGSTSCAERRAATPTGVGRPQLLRSANLQSGSRLKPLLRGRAVRWRMRAEAETPGLLARHDHPDHAARHQQVERGVLVLGRAARHRHLDESAGRIDLVAKQVRAAASALLQVWLDRVAQRFERLRVEEYGVAVAAFHACSVGGALLEIDGNRRGRIACDRAGGIDRIGPRERHAHPSLAIHARLAEQAQRGIRR